jgi:hypothetical protein
MLVWGAPLAPGDDHIVSVTKRGMVFATVLVSPRGIEPVLTALKWTRVNQLHDIEEVESYAALRNGAIRLRFSLIAFDSS